MAGAEVLPGMPAGWSFASAANGDGTVIAGTMDTAGGREVFRWTETSGLQRLGDLPGGTVDASVAGISADGTVIAGNSDGASRPRRVRRRRRATILLFHPVKSQVLGQEHRNQP